MAGSTLTFDLDATDALRKLGALRGLMADATPLMRRLGVRLALDTQHRFAEGRDPEGNPWAPLNPLYAAFEKRGPSILIGAQGMSGGLQGSIVSVASPHQVAIGSNKAYAAIHQFGGVIVPKNARALVFRLGGRLVHAQRVTMPARPYLGLSSADRAEILVQTGRFLGAVLGRGR